MTLFRRKTPELEAESVIAREPPRRAWRDGVHESWKRADTKTMHRLPVKSPIGSWQGLKVVGETHDEAGDPGGTGWRQDRGGVLDQSARRTSTGTGQPIRPQRCRRARGGKTGGVSGKDRRGQDVPDDPETCLGR